MALTPLRRARWIALGLALVVAATGVGVVLSRDGGRSRAAYLRFVGRQATTMFDQVEPVQRLVTSLEFENSPTQPSLELYSARDAFADSSPANAVHAIARALHGARVPNSFGRENQDLYDAADQIARVLSGFAALSAVTDARRLGREFVGSPGKQLESSERRWSAALGRIFPAQHVPPTLDPDTLPDFAPTFVTWTFNSDLACWKDVIDVEGLEQGSRPTARVLARIAQAYRDAAYQLRNVAPPADAPAAVRTGVAARVGGLDDLAHILDTWSRLDHFPQSLADQARRVVSRLTPLSSTYEQHHVHACASLTGLNRESPFGPLPGRSVQT